MHHADLLSMGGCLLVLLLVLARVLMLLVNAQLQLRGIHILGPQIRQKSDNNQKK